MIDHRSLPVTQEQLEPTADEIAAAMPYLLQLMYALDGIQQRLEREAAAVQEVEQSNVSSRSR
jgi:hypothetical protein